MKHLSDYNNFINEDAHQIIILESPCYSNNSKYKYRWVVKVNKDDVLKSIMFVQQLHDDWGGTPGQWYVGTLLNKEGFYGNNSLVDTISIDAGQHWEVFGLQKALEEVQKVLNID